MTKIKDIFFKFIFRHNFDMQRKLIKESKDEKNKNKNPNDDEVDDSDVQVRDFFFKWSITHFLLSKIISNNYNNKIILYVWNGHFKRILHVWNRYCILSCLKLKYFNLFDK